MKPPLCNFFDLEIEFDVDLDPPLELEPVELELELREPEPDSEPLESDPESLDREARRLEGLGCVANLEVILRLLLPVPVVRSEFLEDDEVLALVCPLSLLLLELLHVDSGLTAPCRSLFRYTFEDLTWVNKSEDDPVLEAINPFAPLPPPPDEVPEVLLGDNGVSFQLIKLEPPRLFRLPLLLLELELFVLFE